MVDNGLGALFVLMLLSWLGSIMLLMVVFIPIYVFIRGLFGYFNDIVK